MDQSTEIDSTEEVNFDESKKDDTDSDSDSSGVDVAADKNGKLASVGNKYKKKRSKKKAMKLISTLGLKQVFERYRICKTVPYYTIQVSK